MRKLILAIGLVILSSDIASARGFFPPGMWNPHQVSRPKQCSCVQQQCIQARSYHRRSGLYGCQQPVCVRYSCR